MGEVIATYRKKLYRKQEDFATAAGVTARAVQEWETNSMTADMGRRILLAKMLKIPPALLGLDWHQVFYNNQEEYTDPLPTLLESLEEDAFYAYEDILVMGHEYIHNGGPIDTVLRVDRRLQKLTKIVKNVRPTDKEAWLALLCRYYQLSTRIRQQCLKDENIALLHAKKALEIAKELQDTELIAASLVHSAITHNQQGASEKAREEITSAITYAEKLGNAPLKGNIYLEWANIHAQFAIEDQQLQKQCKTWQDKAATMLYKEAGKTEKMDETFFRFNISAVHHERARTSLTWCKTKNDCRVVQEKLIMAIEVLPLKLPVWKGYYAMTEAKAYLAENDLESSAHAAKLALHVAQEMHSAMVEKEVSRFFWELKAKSANHPQVCNLGMRLGLY